MTSQLDTMMVTQAPTPDKQLADIARSQYRYYQDKYIPFENSLINMAGNNGQLATDARRYYDRVSTPLSAVGARMDARYGVQPNARQMMGR
ncbi:MAG: hypothetical protein IE913_08250, partial [Halothiobacillus sp.]|nr:hypothetical protein [Halothiobacillus sp.]